MKNVFYFVLKTLFVLKLFKFLSQQFGQLIEHNQRNIFPQKLCGKKDGKLVPVFLKKV